MVNDILFLLKIVKNFNEEQGIGYKCCSKLFHNGFCKIKCISDLHTESVSKNTIISNEKKKKSK